MKSCFVVLAEPGDRFLGVHHTISGAVHNAAAEGATTMPDGCPITVSDVFATMKQAPMLVLGCPPGHEFEGIRIERHVIMV
ncbi:hypothetical protein [Sphingomonas sp. TZW2008]|uniref:hypothetical protein n=1 Tax=Sphingomonas sp. TZW2008 TaxID=1917973 RepID=UPI000A269148|nr:hypothetical protein [Sphingomonas sp. TZW2008]